MIASTRIVTNGSAGSGEWDSGLLCGVKSKFMRPRVYKKPMTVLTPGIVTKICGLHLRFTGNGSRRITLETLNAIQ